jgi:hypothetical protein
VTTDYAGSKCSGLELRLRQLALPMPFINLQWRLSASSLNDMTCILFLCRYLALELLSTPRAPSCGVKVHIEDGVD